MEPSGGGSSASRPQARERRRRPVDAERQKRLEALRHLSVDEVRALRDFTRELRRRYKDAEDSGKPRAVEDIRQEIMKELPEVDDDGVNDDLNTRSIPRWKRMELIPGERLRPGAEKMVLRPEEEDELPLHRMGHGNLFSPRKLLGRPLPGYPQHDAAWGIFAMPEAAERALRKRWARRDPVQVLGNELFYFDVLRKCHQLDLTLMLRASRPLPLAQAQEQLEGRLRQGMEALSGGNLREQDEADLKKFIRNFDEEQLQKRASGILDRGAVKEGTHFFLGTTTKGELLADAMTPGPIRDRKFFRVAASRNPLVTGAAFEMFLGLQPLDEPGKHRVGNSLLWCANGFRFQEGENPDQYEAVVGEDGRPHFPPPSPDRVEWLPRSASIFRLVEDKSRMLLGRIRGARRQLADSEEPEVALQR